MSKTLLVCLLLLGSVIHCSNAVEELEFLDNVVDKYSPALVKQLVIERIEHKLEQLTKLSSSVGLTRDQKSLCQVTYQAFATLAADVKSMDQHEVICGDNTYQKTIRYFISQFSYVNEMFEHEFEHLKHPDLTAYNPKLLLENLNAGNLETVRKQTIASIEASIIDVDKIVAEDEIPKELEVLGQGVSNELKDIVKEMKSWIYQNFEKLEDVITRFQQLIDIFYRQLELLTGAKKFY